MMSATLRCLLAMLLLAGSARADDKPLWEIGAAAGGAYVPHYPAADQSQLTGLALPFAIYRGELLRVDEDGIRSEVDLSRRLQFQLGADASFAANSGDNRARRGLPDLDYLVELGPSLEYRLVSAGARSLTAVAQVRAAFAVNTDRFDDVGLAAEPQLIYRDRALGSSRAEWTLGLSAKLADQRLNDYFYSVDPAFVTGDRPAFKARSGYQGSALSSALYYPFNPRLSVVLLSQLLLHSGAANDRSPLFRRDFNYAIGAGLSYSLFLSEARAR